MTPPALDPDPVPPQPPEHDEPVPLNMVLGVVAAFEPHGGASRALVAWELAVPERWVAPAWTQAQREHLISAIGREPVLGEETFRLSPRGRTLLAPGHDAAQPTLRQP